MQPYTGVVMFFLSHIVDPLKAKDKDLRHSALSLVLFKSIYNIPNKRRRDHGLHEIKDSTLADQVVNQAGGESPNLYFKRSFNRLFCLT